MRDKGVGTSLITAFFTAMFLSATNAYAIKLHSEKVGNTTWIPITQTEQGLRAIKIGPKFYYAVTGGLAVWDTSVGRMAIVPFDDQMNLSEIRGLELVQGQIWLVGRNSGIHVFDPVTGKFKEHFAIGERGEGYNANMKSVYDPFANAIWFGHVLNVDRYDIATRQWKNLNSVFQAQGIGKPGSDPNFIISKDGVWIVGQKHATSSGTTLRCDHSGVNCALAKEAPPTLPPLPMYKDCPASAANEAAVCGNDLVVKTATGWSIVHNDTSPFNYEINRYDTSNYLGPLISCHGTDAVLVASGGLQSLDTKSLEMTPVKGGAGFHFDGHWGIEDQRDKVLISIDYDCGDCENLPPSKRFEYDFSKRELMTLATGPESGTMQRGTGACDLADGRKLEATGAGIKISDATGSSVAEAERIKNQDGLIATLEFLNNNPDMNPYPMSGPSQLSQFFTVENLMHTAHSPNEKEGLLKRVIDSKGGTYAKLYASCALAELHWMQEDSNLATSDYNLIAKDFSGIIGEMTGGAANYCRKTLMPPEMRWLTPARTEEERDWHIRCVAVEQIRRGQIPTLLRIDALRKRIAAYHANKLDSKEAYRSLLLLEYVIKNHMEALQSRKGNGDPHAAKVEETVGGLIQNDPELQDLKSTQLQAAALSAAQERNELLRKDPTLNAISIYGPQLVVSMDDLLRDGHVSKGSFRFKYEKESEPCP